MRGQPWEPVMVRSVPVWEHARCTAPTTYADYVRLRSRQALWSRATRSARTGSRAPHPRGSAHASHMLVLSTSPIHAKGIAQAVGSGQGSTRRGLCKRCVAERGACQLCPTLTPHCTSDRQTQAVQTSDLLIITWSPLCPGKGGGPGGRAQHAPPFLRGLIPPPSWAGSRGRSIRPAGTETEVGRAGASQ